MHSERCMSGSARGRVKLLISRAERRTRLTQPSIPMARDFVHQFRRDGLVKHRVLSWRLSNTNTAMKALSPRKNL